MRWVCGCGGGGGFLIGLCSWVVFVVCVRGGGGLSQAITVVCGRLLLVVVVVWVFFCWLSLGFFVAGFVGLLNFGCFYV